jgi:ArsR family transcriptional regulator
MRASNDEIFRLHANVCKGLGDPKRLLIINALRDGERSVSDICEELGIPQANISQHLSILRDKGLVKARKDGQRVHYSLSSPRIVEAMDLLRQVMVESFGELAQVVR